MLNDVPFVHSTDTWEMFIPGQPLLTGYATVHNAAMSYLTAAFNIKYVVYDLIQSLYVKTKYVGVRQDKLHFRILAEAAVLRTQVRRFPLSMWHVDNMCRLMTD